MAWAVKVSTDELALMMEAGLIYRYAGKFREAREVFEGVRALRPQSEVPQIALGTVEFDEGRFQEAIRHYQKAISMNPRSAYAYAQLGEAQLFHMDKQAARASLEKALELDPKGEPANLARALLKLTDQVEFRHS
jgi:tetratricopeptide (TPR) repeat protein